MDGATGGAAAYETARIRPSGFRGLPPSLRWTVYVVLALVVLLIGTSITAVVVVRRSWPQVSGTLSIDGLRDPVEVVRGPYGVPQIYADTTHDLMLAQGFVHAQERFFQMDVNRHATAGTLSSMFGEAGLETDVVVRTLGWRRVATKALRLLEPATRDALDSYADGVNAYLADRSLSEISLEYSLLDVAGLDSPPAKWTAVDSIAWLEAMAWDLRSNVDDEAGRAVLDTVVGPDRTAQLYPAYDSAAHPPIVTRGTVKDGAFDPEATATSSALRPPPKYEAGAILAGVRDVLSAVPPLLGSGDGIGSNGWVVAGSRTGSGAPILANDPHLGVSLPGVWMQVGLHCRSVSSACPYDVAGSSFPGVPGVIIGHNRDIAWGFTNLGADVSDLYVERIAGEEWQYDGRRRPLRVRTEVIEVRGQEDLELTVRSTRHGPLLSDLVDLDERSDRVDLTEGGLMDLATAAGGASAPAGVGTTDWGYGVSLAWTALRPRPVADAVLALNRAEDWQSFRSALSDFAVPGQNVVYADTDGHIGYQATGELPVRAPGHDGSRPVAGWRSQNDWRGTVPYAAMHWAFDPPSGAIVTANQQPVSPDALDQPMLGAAGADWDRGFRASRISELLAADKELSVEAMETIQLDDRNPFAPVLTPYLLDIDLPHGYYGAGQRMLRRWDFRQPADSGAAAYFNAVWRRLLLATFNDELPVGLRPGGEGRWFDVVAGLLERPRDPWWDDVTTDDVVETRDDILKAAMRDARDELTEQVSPAADDWTWGALHRLDLRSSTLGESGIGIVESIFNRGRWQVGGGGSIVDATGWDAQEGYEVTTAPSMRMVIPLDDLDESRWINLTGVSGHAFHEHYTDQTDLWARGEYLPWRFTREAVLAGAEHTLDLVPAD